MNIQYKVSNRRKARTLFSVTLTLLSWQTVLSFNETNSISVFITLTIVIRVLAVMTDVNRKMIEHYYFALV